jgi:hypothetical protein
MQIATTSSLSWNLITHLPRTLILCVERSGVELAGLQLHLVERWICPLAPPTTSDNEIGCYLRKETRLLEFKLQMREAAEIELGLNHPGADCLLLTPQT